LHADGSGYFDAIVDDVDVTAGIRYQFLLDNSRQRPDPASRYQPDGVHGASQVFDPAEYPWQDAGWMGVALDKYVLYETHVGVFTRDGTFAAVIPRLDELKDLGVTAIEIMPVSQFPGRRKLGIRRSGSLCGTEQLRWSARTSEAGRRLPRARSGGGPRCCLQPPRARRELSR